MKQIDLIIFDLDGTLINSLKDIAISLNFTIERLGLERLDEEKVRSYIGSGIKKLMEDVLGSDKDSRAPEMIDFFREHHEKHLLDNTVLYPGVRETLQFFSPKKKAVISNKNREFSVAILKGLGAEDYFDVVLGPEDTLQRKPSPEPILNVLARLNINQSKTLMIGDNPIDIEAGKSAGVFTCGVTYGFCKKEDIEKANPDFVINDLRDLKNLII